MGVENDQKKYISEGKKSKKKKILKKVSKKDQKQVEKWPQNCI